MMKVAMALALTLLLNGGPATADSAEARLSPYVADYKVKYGSLSVGTSRTELSRTQVPDLWVMETRLSASGLGRLVADGDLLQYSSFQFDAAGLRPLRYRFDDGTKRSERDVTLQFDWRAGRVTGIAEESPVDVVAESGLQDAASSQAFVQWRLQGGAEPGVVAMIEKDKIKYYRYTLLRRERLKTDIGVLETVVYRSARDGSSRENLFWYAPQLGYAIVQAEQRRDGKRLFQTYISGYRPGS
ncbi:MAG TPA: DUF3108 domain-containing protein [Steroidobacteraceae bacterium]